VSCCTEFNQVVIFVRDKRRCATLNKILQENKFPSIELHSDMQVEDRCAGLARSSLCCCPLIFTHGCKWASKMMSLIVGSRVCACLHTARLSLPLGACWPHNFSAEMYREKGISIS
jgi:hypothetical protein